MRTPIIAGNWKMHMTVPEARELVQGMLSGIRDREKVEVVLGPPYTALSAVADLIRGTGIGLAGQNVHWEEKGAFTGEISAAMLKDAGCTYVIIGHSERRSIYGETDADVAEKFKVAQAGGLIPILCVGETLEERQADETEQVVARQLDAVIDAAGVAALANAVIAYEPVWAIGTGMTASPEQAQEVHQFIRGRIAALDSGVADGLRILYGGSMKPDNAAELLAQADIDGGLIGGASLEAESFLGICRAAN